MAERQEKEGVTAHPYLDDVGRAVASLRAALGTAEVGIILGSGLADATPALEGVKSVPYTEIPGFPATTVAGHSGKLAVGTVGGTRVAVMQGRFHYYEGHEMGRVAFPLHVFKGLGVRTVIVTAAVGSMAKTMKPGSLVVLNDHINFMGANPLRGLIGPGFGEMFPDMTEPYDRELRKAALKAAKKLKIPAREGVYVAFGGPSYETPAEIRAFRRLGADVVGMSTVPEVIAARQLGMKVLAVTWVANLAAGVSKDVLSHADVLAFGRQVAGRIRSLLTELLPGAR